MSTSTVFARCRELGEELGGRMGMVTGKKPEGVAFSEKPNGERELLPEGPVVSAACAAA